MKNNIHWMTPAVMVGALLMGTFFALSHHLLNDHLDQQPVPPSTVHYNLHVTRISKQKVNIFAGTAFAFLVKACLGAAVSTAYAQILWRSVRKQTLAISTVDTLFSALSNAFVLPRLAVWLRYPILSVLAISVWLLPLASVVTPSTLTTQDRLQNTTFNKKIPSLDLSGELYLDGDVSALHKIFSRTAAQGVILPIGTSMGDSSWSLDFQGPSLSCSDTSGSIRTKILDTLIAAMKASNCQFTYGYMSWRSTDTPRLTTQDCQPSEASIWEYGCTPPVMDVHALTNGASIHPLRFAVFPNMVQHNHSEPWWCTDLEFARVLDQSTIIECFPQTVMYHAEFKRRNGFQTIAIQRSEPVGVYRIDEEWNGHTEMKKMMAEVLEGTMYYDYFHGDLVIKDTSVMTTNIVDIDQLAYLKFADTKQQVLNVTTGITLAQKIEEFFQNITFSIMSDERFLRNDSLADVTFTRTQNEYKYEASVLWLSYGLAIVVSTLGVCLGLYAIIAADAAYSTVFSTIMRATRTAELSTSIHSLDADGQDPLPPYLAKAQITLTELPRRRNGVSLLADSDVGMVDEMHIPMVRKAFWKSSKSLDESSSTFSVT